MAMLQIPLLAAQAQAFSVVIAGVTYQMRIAYADAPDGGWFLDLADRSGNSIVAGVPLVTGVDLMKQYAYLGLGFHLYVATDGAPELVPTFEDLGVTSRLFVEVDG